MTKRQDHLRSPAPRSTSLGNSSAGIELINDLPGDLVVSAEELAALELLVGWGWLDQILQTCGGSEADV